MSRQVLPPYLDAVEPLATSRVCVAEAENQIEVLSNTDLRNVMGLLLAASSRGQVIS
jgi:hypothetical protein